MLNSLWLNLNLPQYISEHVSATHPHTDTEVSNLLCYDCDIKNSGCGNFFLTVIIVMMKPFVIVFILTAKADYKVNCVNDKHKQKVDGCCVGWDIHIIYIISIMTHILMLSMAKLWKCDFHENILKFVERQNHSSEQHLPLTSIMRYFIMDVCWNENKKERVDALPLLF